MGFGELVDEALSHTGDLAPPRTFGPMSGRDHRWVSPEEWFANKRKDDAVEWDGRPAWRIHGDVYDLEAFAEKHPGGAFWILQTRGTDITEAFEVAHPDIKKARALLDKYKLGPATKPRVSPLTFHPRGFFSVFRRRALPVIKAAGDGPKRRSNRIADSFMAAWLLGMAVAGRSKGLAAAASSVASGVVLGLMAIIGHNYYHQRDNWRMYLGDLAGSSYVFGRQTHALGHHLYVNSWWDPETHASEPGSPLLPSSKREPGKHFTSFWRLLPFFALVTPAVLVTRPLALLSRGARDTARQVGPAFRRTDLLGYSSLAFLYLVSGSFKGALWRWLLMHAASSFSLLGVASTTSHNSPSAEKGPWHQGDPDMPTDFGLYHLEATTDRAEVRGSHVLSLCTFGDHTLHHLLPTVDHGYLPLLYPVLEKTCRDFGVEFGFQTWLETCEGYSLALNRTEPLKQLNRVNLGKGVTDRLLDEELAGTD
ncbi:fatty acid desaturase-domain-containing protein [Hyaloraphidium curvatum]|nr:fatty acid desaturase-domain-containing protein [Hyaloraphidium curvatum]